MRRPTRKELEGLSVDELCKLRETLGEILSAKITEEKRILEEWLKRLRSGKRSKTSNSLTGFGAENND